MLVDQRVKYLLHEVLQQFLFSGWFGVKFNLSFPSQPDLAELTPTFCVPASLNHQCLKVSIHMDPLVPDFLTTRRRRGPLDG